MIIKLAVLHNDISFLNRLESALNRLETTLSADYPNKITFFSFSDPDLAVSALIDSKIDVFLAEDLFEISMTKIPPKCGFAYLVDSPDINSVRGQTAVCRFQPAKLLYKQILGIFSDALGDTSVRNIFSDNAKVLIFSSPCGGTGTSTLAAACALYYASSGKRPVYLNLENFSGADVFFRAEGASDMSDVAYALKSRKGNISIKLESCIRRDYRGVSFFNTAQIALDIIDLSIEDKIALVSALSESGQYDYIIVDADFDIHSEALELYRIAHKLIWVMDPSPISRFKTERAYRAMQVLEENNPRSIMERIYVHHNKAAEGRPLPETQIPLLGSTPKIRHKVDEQILEQLAAIGPFSSLFDM